MYTSGCVCIFICVRARIRKSDGDVKVCACVRFRVRVRVVVIHTPEGLNFPMASVPAKGPVATDVAMETRAGGKGPAACTHTHTHAHTYCTYAYTCAHTHTRAHSSTGERKRFRPSRACARPRMCGGGDHSALVPIQHNVSSSVCSLPVSSPTVPLSAAPPPTAEAHSSAVAARFWPSPKPAQHPAPSCTRRPSARTCGLRALPFTSRRAHHRRHTPPPRYYRTLCCPNLAIDFQPQKSPAAHTQRYMRCTAAEYCVMYLRTHVAIYYYIHNALTYSTRLSFLRITFWPFLY